MHAKYDSLPFGGLKSWIWLFRLLLKISTALYHPDGVWPWNILTNDVGVKVLLLRIRYSAGSFSDLSDFISFDDENFIFSMGDNQLRNSCNNVSEKNYKIQFRIINQCLLDASGS